MSEFGLLAPQFTTLGTQELRWIDVLKASCGGGI